MNGRISHLLIVVPLLAFACNLSQAGTSTPPANTQVAPISLIPTSTPVVGEEYFPPTDLTELYRQKVDSGEWTEAEGLVFLLKAALGESDIEIPESVVEGELTGIAALANQYLRVGSDEDSKLEIQRLLSLLFPSEEKLQAYSIPESEAGLASPKFAIPVAQVESDCQAFWSIELSEAPTYPCFLWGQENIAGQEHRVYFPLAFRGDDAKFLYYRATQEAIRDSIGVYSEFGPMPRVSVIFHYDLEWGGGGSPLSVLAMAPQVEAEEACLVVIFPPVFNMEVNSYKQVVAHELFHCFQHKHIMQHRPTTSFETALWYIEGSAEYFSNVVYPETDGEYRNIQRLNEMSLRIPVYQLSYRNFLFFQHMGNQWGNEKTIAMMKAMPITGSFQDQLNAIVAYPGFIELYESYARHYVANQIADTSGIIYPYEILYAKVNLVSGPQPGQLPHNPFVLYREKFIYDAPLLKYSFATSAPANIVRIATAPVDFPVWQVPTWNVDTTCNRWEYMTYSIGVSNNPLGQLADYAITTEVVSADTPCEQCLIGTWQLDPSSYLIYANSLFPRRMNTAIAVGWDGDMFMEYTAAGKVAATYNNFKVFYKGRYPDPNGGRPIQSNLTLGFTPTSAVGYIAGDATIAYSGARGSIQAIGETVLPDGTRFPFNVPAGAFAGADLPLSENYVCKGDFLSIVPILPGSVPNIPEPIYFLRYAPPIP